MSHLNISKINFLQSQTNKEISSISSEPFKYKGFLIKFTFGFFLVSGICYALSKNKKFNKNIISPLYSILQNSYKSIHTKLSQIQIKISRKKKNNNKDLIKNDHYDGISELFNEKKDEKSFEQLQKEYKDLIKNNDYNKISEFLLNEKKKDEKSFEQLQEKYKEYRIFMQERQEYMNKIIAKVDSDIAKVDSDIAKVNTYIAKVDSDIAKVDSDIAKVDSDIAKVDSDNEKLKILLEKTEKPNNESETFLKKVEESNDRMLEEDQKDRAQSKKERDEFEIFLQERQDYIDKSDAKIDALLEKKKKEDDEFEIFLEETEKFIDRIRSEINIPTNSTLKRKKDTKFEESCKNLENPLEYGEKLLNYWERYFQINENNFKVNDEMREMVELNHDKKISFLEKKEADLLEKADELEEQKQKIIESYRMDEKKAEGFGNMITTLQTGDKAVKKKFEADHIEYNIEKNEDNQSKNKEVLNELKKTKENLQSQKEKSEISEENFNKEIKLVNEKIKECEVQEKEYKKKNIELKKQYEITYKEFQDLCALREKLNLETQEGFKEAEKKQKMIDDDIVLKIHNEEIQNLKNQAYETYCHKQSLFHQPSWQRYEDFALECKEEYERIDAKYIDDDHPAPRDISFWISKECNLNEEVKNHDEDEKEEFDGIDEEDMEMIREDLRKDAQEALECFKKTQPELYKRIYETKPPSKYFDNLEEIETVFDEKDQEIIDK